jgi:hypothetical protein
MHLVEDDAIPTSIAKKALRVIHRPTGSGQLAIEVFDLVEALAKKGLAGAPDAGEPDKRAFLPGLLEGVSPICAIYHMQRE